MTLDDDSSDLNRINIFAFGSPFGDDVIGWRLADGLIDARMPSDAGIRISQLDRPVLTLTQRLDPAVPTLIIDAMMSGAAIGSLQELTIAQMPAAMAQLSSHSYGLLSCLQLAQALGRLPDICLVLAIEISPKTKPGDTLSDSLAQRLKPLTELVLRRARQLIQQQTTSAGCNDTDTYQITVHEAIEG